MSEAPDRFISFERCFNFRDLGGYAGLDGRAVRWRRLFRSMTPQYMSPADAIAVDRLNLGLVIDFRGQRYERSGPLPAQGGLRVALSPPFVQRTESEAERYRVLAPEEALPRLLQTYGPYFAAALTAIAKRPEASALFHCRLGKDRTGVFAALLLKLLGVSDEDTVQDYLLTAHQEAEARRLIAEDPDDSLTPEKEPAVVRESPRRPTIEAVLRRLFEEYGGAYGYFAQHGVSAGLIGAFVEAALEPPESPPPTPGASADALPAV
jgi:protein-tyrosine phosphatase